jgi:4-carboxymuconolactone decarboxylase
MKALLSAVMAVGLASPGLAAERFPALAPDQMTAAQKNVADKIMGSRKNLSGPFSAWLRSPELADRFQAVGDYLRFHSELPRALTEFVILITAREWTSQFEWQFHAPLAMAAGIDKTVIADLGAGRRPRGMNADQVLVYDFSMSLHRAKGRVPDRLFDAVKARFGERATVDLICLNGYYDAVAMTLGAANVAGPGGGEAPPLR